MKIKHMFEAAGVKVFGAILNDVPINNVDSCRFHRDYYSALPPASHSVEATALPAERR